MQPHPVNLKQQGLSWKQSSHRKTYASVYLQLKSEEQSWAPQLVLITMQMKSDT